MSKYLLADQHKIRHSILHTLVSRSIKDLTLSGYKLPFWRIRHSQNRYYAAFGNSDAAVTGLLYSMGSPQQAVATSNKSMIFLHTNPNSFITVKSHEHHDVLNHRQLKCLLINLFRLTSKEMSKLRFSVLSNLSNNHLDMEAWNKTTQWWQRHNVVFWSGLWQQIAVNTMNSSPPVPKYASVNRVSTDSGNGLAQNRRQAVTWINAGLLSTGPSVKFESKYKTFYSWKCIWNFHLRNGGHFVWASMF